jgi:hypothetical protein
MIKRFVSDWEKNKEDVRIALAAAHPEGYKEIVKLVITAISKDYDYDYPDPERIHVIDDGDYQGTLLFVIGGQGYQPNDYYFVKVYYGSCSGCDTLQGIHGYSDDPPTEVQVKDYMTLALHIFQNLTSMQEDNESV